MTQLETSLRTESFVADHFGDKILSKWRRYKVLPFVSKGAVVCDLGCGLEASFLKLIEGDISKGYGFDVDVNKDFESQKIALEKADLNLTLPLPDGSVDVLTSMAVLEHIDDYQAHIRDIARMVKKGGTAALTTPTAIAHPVIQLLARLHIIGQIDADDHKRYFNPPQLKQLFLDAGFSEVKVTRFQLGFNQLIVAKK